MPCCSDTSETPKTKPELAARWWMLALLCTGLVGSYYSYDIPSATITAMESAFGGNATASTDDDGGGGGGDTFSVNFNLLYSVYSWPNVVLPFLGGYLSDRLGVRLMLLVFLGFISLGQVVFALGASLQGDSAWHVMWAGRTIFGFGGESLSVAQSALIASWFAGKELAFALGLNLALARLGSVINDLVSVAVANNDSVAAAFWVGAIVCGVSLAAGLATYLLDERSEDRLRANRGLRPKTRASLLEIALCVPAWRRCCMSEEQREAAALAELDRKVEEGGDGDGGYKDEPEPEVIEIWGVATLPPTFWLLCVSCVCTYACVLCFNNFAAGFFTQKWLAQENGAWLPVSQLSEAKKKDISTHANNFLLIPYLTAAFLAPLMGGVIDRVGYRAALTAFAAGLITVVHVLLAYFPRDAVQPEGPLVLLGVCYSIYASALWPSVAKVAEPKYHATAYGVVTAVQCVDAGRRRRSAPARSTASITPRTPPPPSPPFFCRNLGLAAIPIGVGKLMPSPSCATYDECVNGYKNVETLLICFGGAGFVASLLLNVADASARKHVLNWSDAKLKAFEKAEAEGGGEGVEARLLSSS
jgi:MFS family permease